MPNMIDRITFHDSPSAWVGDAPVAVAYVPGGAVMVRFGAVDGIDAYIVQTVWDHDESPSTIDGVFVIDPDGDQPYVDALHAMADAARIATGWDV